MEAINEGEPIATGERIYLRRLMPSDATERYVCWLNDPKINKYLESRFTRHTVQSIRSHIDDARRDSSQIFCAIIRKVDQRHIGNIRVGPLVPHHLCAEVGILIGDESCWGQGLATEAIRLASQYAFAHTPVRRLSAGMYADNIGSLRAFEKAGYLREGVERSKWWNEGRWVDGIRLSLLKDEVIRGDI